MKSFVSATLTVVGVFGLSGLASAEALTKTGTCSVPSQPAAKHSLTEAVQNDRYTVLQVSRPDGRIVVRSGSGSLYELSCNGATAEISAGDVVSMAGPNEIKVVRRAGQETGSFER